VDPARDDVADALVGFARRNGATQIFVLRHCTCGLAAFGAAPGPAHRALAPDMQVTVVADRSQRAASLAPAAVRR
jgi:hypothetical protein